MMFFVFLIFALTAAQPISAEIPPYFHVCGRRNPKLGECIVQSAEMIKDKFCVGIPELDILPLEPLYLDKVDLTDRPNERIIARDIYVRGLCDYHVNSMHIDLKKQLINDYVTFRNLRVNSTYDINVRLLVPIVAQGTILVNAKNVSAKVRLKYDITPKGNKNIMQIKSTQTSLNIRNFDVKFLSQDNPSMDVLYQALQDFVKQNRDVVIERLGPQIEKLISEKIFTLTNTIFRHFDYDEILPDRE